MFSFSQLYGLNESPTQISMEDINTFKEDRLFVTVGSHTGSPNPFLTTQFGDLPIIEVKAYTTRVGGGVYHRSNLSEGRRLFQASIDKALEGNESFVHIGSNTNLEATKNRLQKAKDNGFTNILVLIESNIDEDARNVFNQLKKDNSLVDFYVHKRK